MIVGLGFLSGVVGAGKADTPSKESVPKKFEPKHHSWMLNVPEPVLGDIPSLPPCHVVYIASWSKFIDVGFASITLTPKVDERRLRHTLGFLNPSVANKVNDNLIMGVANASTQGPVRFLWSYDCDVFSVFDPAKNNPVALHFKEVQDERRIDFYGEFGRNRFRSYRNRGLALQREGVQPTSLTFKNIPKPLDLLSSILYFRSLPLNVGDEIQLVSCPNEHPYLVIITVEAHEEHELEGKKVPSIRLRMAIKSVEKDGSLSAHKKFKTATVWVEKNRHRLPLEIRAEVFVGSVTVIMKSYKELNVRKPKISLEAEQVGLH